MQTKKRLDSALNKAKIMPIDENSKIILFSDVHRGDDSFSDEFAQNQIIYQSALHYYYKEGFKYIELGDGDELWEHKHFKYIRYAHIETYLLLKKFYDADRFEMLYGNHNMEFKYPKKVKEKLYFYIDDFTDERKALFPGIAVYESLILRHKSRDILLIHGHQGDFTNDQIWFVNRFFLRYFWRYMHKIGFRNPASPAKNAHHRHNIEKKFSSWIEENNQMIIMGHTHRVRFPDEGELPYFNTGTCIYPRRITGIEIIGDLIQSVEWRIHYDKSGYLKTSRKVLRGPRNINDI